MFISSLENKKSTDEVSTNFLDIKFFVMHLKLWRLIYRAHRYFSHSWIYSGTCFLFIYCFFSFLLTSSGSLFFPSTFLAFFLFVFYLLLSLLPFPSPSVFLPLLLSFSFPPSLPFHLQWVSINIANGDLVPDSVQCEEVRITSSKSRKLLHKQLK